MLLVCPLTHEHHKHSLLLIRISHSFTRRMSRLAERFNITQHIRLLRTVKPQLYTRIKQSAGLKYIKVNTYCGTTF